MYFDLINISAVKRINMDYFANPNLINVIQNSCIDDFFFFGFISGILGDLIYRLAVKQKDDKLTFSAVIVSLYGTILSGALGGLLAIVFDKDIRISILVGLLNQIIYNGMIRSVKSGNFWLIIKELLIKILTGGKI
jgi:hypothetical protein